MTKLAYFYHMILVDTHTHLYLNEFDEDRKQVINSAVESGVKYMLFPRIDSKSFDDQKNLSNLFPDNCLSMMGLHPTSVDADFEKELEIIEKELKSSKYIAVGEIGIDLYWDKTFKEQQEYAFRKQLQLAKQFELPVSIHMRDSFEEIYKIVKDENTDKLTGVFHCFTGSIEQAKKVMDLGFKMGIGGIVTFKNAGLAEVLKEINLEIKKGEFMAVMGPSTVIKMASAFDSLLASRIRFPERTAASTGNSPAAPTIAAIT